MVRVAYKNSVACKAKRYVADSRAKVFLREDFKSFGSYRQVSRVLAKLIDEGLIVKIGSGIYAKAMVSQYFEEPLLDGGFDNVAREALDRIGASWEPGAAEQEYNAGVTQQIPMHNTVKLQSRLRRTISYQNRQLFFEGNINAK